MKYPILDHLKHNPRIRKSFRKQGLSVSAILGKSSVLRTVTICG